MQEDILEPENKDKYFNNRVIIISSFFGGVMASSFMIFKNFKKAGEHDKAMITAVLALAYCIFIFYSIFSPRFDNVPDIVYSLFFTLLTALLVTRFQKPVVEKRIKEGASYHSNGTAILVCVISILVMVVLLFGAFYAQDMVQYNY